MSCRKGNTLKCITDGIGVMLFIPTTTTSTTTEAPCYIVDCNGDYIVDCECNYLSCGDCTTDCYVVDCEGDFLVDCEGDYIICQECGPSSEGDFVSADFESSDFLV
jgi:hypothetical protein